MIQTLPGSFLGLRPSATSEWIWPCLHSSLCQLNFNDAGHTTSIGRQSGFNAAYATVM